MEEALVKEFGRYGQKLDDTTLVNKCATLCRSFSIKPADLAVQWDAFCFSTSTEQLQLSSEALDKLKPVLERKYGSTGGVGGSSNSARKTPSVRRRDNVEVYTKDTLHQLQEITSTYGDFQPTFYDTPDSRSNKRARSPLSERLPRRPFSPSRSPEAVGSPMATEPSISTGPIMDQYSTRENSGKTVCTFNESISLVAEENDSSIPVEPTLVGENNLTQPYKFMYESLDAKTKVLENRLEKLREAMSTLEDLKEVQIQPLNTTSQEKVAVAGMVCCDTDGKLNAQSVMLQGTSSDGLRLKLNLSELPSFALFPGQIVVVEGMNARGKELIASKLWQGAPLPFDDRTADTELSQSEAEAASTPLTIVAAAGPFTTTANLSYQPLADLLDSLRSSPPDVLILMGPFIDVQHPVIKCGGPEEHTFEELFIERVSELLHRFLGPGVRTSVVLVPSTRDALHPFVFPQPPLSTESLELPSEAVCLSNPCTFRVRGVTIGISTNDILKALAAEEAPRQDSTKPSDRMARLADHLVSQQSYYPLFPSQLGSLVNVARSENVDMPCTPDILLLPSELAPFARKCNSNALAVNPGRLAKGSTGGTFSKLIVVPKPKSEEGEGGGGQEVHSRTRVDIIRI